MVGFEPLFALKSHDMKILSLLFFICLWYNIALGQSSLSVAQNHFITKICERDVPPGAPGVACGIVQDGAIVYTYYSGFANLLDSVAISEESRFNIASNAKQFTALAILKLIEEQQLSLDDELKSVLPNLQYTRPITIRQLLTHTSGIRDVYDLWNLQGITWWKQTYSNADALRLLAQQNDLNFTPGETYLYSNSNYILLAEIVARASGQTFREYTNQMFKGLGLMHTAFESDHQRIKAPIALPYFNFDTWSGYEWIWNAVGDGNLFTTLPDLLRWEQIIQDKKRLPNWKKMIDLSQQPVAGAEQEGYGYGLEFGAFKNEPVVFHHGSTGAWKATFMRFPNRNLTVLTLSNSGKTLVVDQNEKIAAYLLGKDKVSDFLLAPEREGGYLAREDILGVYEQAGGTIFKFIEKEDDLYLRREGRNDVVLERRSPNIWQQLYDPAFKQEFTRDSAGHLTVTVYHSSHAPYTLRKIVTDWKGYNFEKWTGTYFNEETGVRMALKHLEEQVYQITWSDKKRQGELLTKNRMRVGSYQLHFFEQQKEDRAGFYLAGDRIRRVYFQKEQE